MLHSGQKLKVHSLINHVGNNFVLENSCLSTKHHQRNIIPFQDMRAYFVCTTIWNSLTYVMVTSVKHKCNPGILDINNNKATSLKGLLRQYVLKHTNPEWKYKLKLVLCHL